MSQIELKLTNSRESRQREHSSWPRSGWRLETSRCQENAVKDNQEGVSTVGRGESDVFPRSSDTWPHTQIRRSGGSMRALSSWALRRTKLWCYSWLQLTCFNESRYRLPVEDEHSSTFSVVHFKPASETTYNILMVNQNRASHKSLVLDFKTQQKMIMQQ